jgi:hypothetical protein
MVRKLALTVGIAASVAMPLGASAATNHDVRCTVSHGVITELSFFGDHYAARTAFTIEDNGIVVGADYVPGASGDVTLFEFSPAPGEHMISVVRPNLTIASVCQAIV